MPERTARDGAGLAFGAFAGLIGVLGGYYVVPQMIAAGGPMGVTLPFAVVFVGFQVVGLGGFAGILWRVIHRPAAPRAEKRAGRVRDNDASGYRRSASSSYGAYGSSDSGGSSSCSDSGSYCSGCGGGGG